MRVCVLCRDVYCPLRSGSLSAYQTDGRTNGSTMSTFPCLHLLLPIFRVSCATTSSFLASSSRIKSPKHTVCAEEFRRFLFRCFCLNSDERRTIACKLASIIHQSHTCAWIWNLIKLIKINFCTFFESNDSKKTFSRLSATVRLCVFFNL